MKIKLHKILLLVPFLIFTARLDASSSRDAAIDSQLITPTQADPSMSDGKAVVYALEGKAMFTAKGSPVERPLKVGDEIHAGDAVYTEKETTLSISFDKKRDNAVRIPADSKAVFTSIEPTDIKLENGSIFNVVNGLAKGSTWKITTPSAVAAVRGTVFIVRYEAANGQMYAATVNVPDDGKTSAIEITALTGESNAEVGEGKEIVLKEGQAPSEDAVKDLSPEAITEIQSFFAEVSSDKDSASDDGSTGTGGTGEGSDVGTGAGAGDGSGLDGGDIVDGVDGAGRDSLLKLDPMDDSKSPLNNLKNNNNGLPEGCTSLPCNLIPDCQATQSCLNQQ